MTSVPTEPKDIKDLHSDHAHLFYCRDGYLYLAQCGAVDEVEFDPDHPGDPIRNCSWPDKGWFLQWGDGPMLGVR